METILVEIRSAEGGDDAKGLILEQLSIYKNFCSKRRL